MVPKSLVYLIHCIISKSDDGVLIKDQDLSIAQEIKRRLINCLK
jgi:hypothetical protein